MATMWNILTMLVTLNTISHGLVESSAPLDKTKFGPAPEGTFKTIEVPEDGDMIDCVDIYKQPAFKDPLIKKDFQMIPSKTYESLFNRTKNPQSNIIQNWNRYGDCPKGSIPIRRTWNNNGSIHGQTRNDDPDEHEYAAAQQHGSIYNGAAANFNIWNPRVTGRTELSLAQLWVMAERNSKSTIIESGWIINELQYHDKQTRFFIHWTINDYRKPCYDLDCQAFVQTNHDWVLGGVFGHVSQVGGEQAELHISFSRDRSTGRWWLEAQGNKVGYYPHFKLPILRDGANSVLFGGEIANERAGNRHTGTHMGSGNFPVIDGSGRVGHVRNIEVINQNFQTEDASLVAHITREECYDLIFGPPETPWRTHFFYGGPGFSERCFTP